MSTNFAKTLVWKLDYDIKLWCHKERTRNTNDHHMSLNKTPMKIFCVRHCWQFPSFAHASQLINLIEIGRCGDIRGSVLPGFRVTMRFYFKLWLVLVTSDCGITAECGVDKSVNTSTAHFCAICETKSLYKNAKCDAYALVCGTNSQNWQAEDQPEVGFFKNNFYPLRLL